MYNINRDIISDVLANHVDEETPVPTTSARITTCKIASKRRVVNAFSRIVHKPNPADRVCMGNVCKNQ